MKYAQTYSADVVNAGDGFHVSIFFSGCFFHCENCFNKECQSFEYGKEYTEDVEKYILSILSNPYIKGLSILGGEPFHQNSDGISKILELCKKVKALDKSVWIWTGHTFEKLVNSPQIKDVLKYTDVLIDGQYVDDLRDVRLCMRGSSNQRIIDVQKSLKENKTVLWNNGDYI